MRIGAVLRTFRRGDTLGRLRALRSAGGAVEIAVVGSALDTGVLTDLVAEPLTIEKLAARRRWDPRLLSAYLEVLAAHRLVRRRGDRWEAAPRGRRVVADDVVQAVYEAFSDYHTGLYRDLEQLLAGVLRRDDVERRGELIARPRTSPGRPSAMRASTGEPRSSVPTWTSSCPRDMTSSTTSSFSPTSSTTCLARSGRSSSAGSPHG